MCKILIVPKITNKTRENALKFMEKMKPLMSQSNTDGLGYAAVDSEGNLFGERFHVNEDSFEEQIKFISSETDEGEILSKKMFDDISSKVFKKSSGSKNSFGKVNLQDITALTMHTRMATSGKEFRNTHPFVYEDDDTSLIHNGVINNTSDFKFKVSSCDSESLLISYVEEGVGKNTKSVQAMANRVRGYYACGVFSRDAEGNRILDVFKGNGANLYGAYIKELETTVMCTSKDNIVRACELLGFTIGRVYELNDGFLMRFSGGEMTEKVKFTEGPRYYDWRSSQTTTTTGTTTNTTSNVPTNVASSKPPVTLSADMSEYLHTIPNIQQIFQ